MSDKKKILIIDDEPDVRTYLTTLLQDNGYDTDTADDGIQGMRKAMADRPDLITLDMSMPEKSGMKFYRELKADASLAAVPVVVVTGVTGFGGSADDFKSFISSRKSIPAPEAFVPKPIDRDELLEILKKLLG